MDIDYIWQKREAKIAIIVIGSILVAWLGMATWMSKIQIAQKNIEQFWGILEDSCHARLELLPKLSQIILDTKAPEALSLTQALNQVYEKNKKISISIQILDDASRLEAFYAAQKEVVNVFINIDKQAPNITALSKNQDYFNVFRQLDMFDAQIIFAKMALNRQVAIYDRIVGSEPQKWINKVYPRLPLKHPVIVPTFSETLHEQR